MTKKHLILLLLAIWFLVSIACNYPGIRTTNENLPADLLRLTLEAKMDATATDVSQTLLPTPVATPTTQNNKPPSSGSTSPTPGELQNGPDGTYSYLTQPGDTLQSVARRFRVDPGQISAPQYIASEEYLPINQLLWIPITFYYPDYTSLLPDSELINSPTANDFNLNDFIQNAAGYISTFYEDVDGQSLSGAEIIQRISEESSINPRLLLAFLEHRSGWVFSQSLDTNKLSDAARDHPLGFYVPNKKGLYQELVMAATHLNIGYYGWRNGDFNVFKFPDGSSSPVNPRLNAGTVGLQNLFAKFYKQADWKDALYGENNFLYFYQMQFGDPYESASRVEPYLTPGLLQPQLELPFSPGERWSLTGGPHYSWNTGSPRGAIDFSPVTGEPSCSVSRAWVTSPAKGVIVRSANNVIALDLDGDGKETTGWVIIFLHIAKSDSVRVGTIVEIDDRLGHPSCERGSSTGTHVHIARKFNGEWLVADEPIPFILSGWQVVAGARNYQGSLVKGSQQVDANPGGPRTSIIVR